MISQHVHISSYSFEPCNTDGMVDAQLAEHMKPGEECVAELIEIASDYVRRELEQCAAVAHTTSVPREIKKEFMGTGMGSEAHQRATAALESQS